MRKTMKGRHWRKLPNHVYVIYRKDDHTVVYVGVSMYPEKRFIEHTMKRLIPKNTNGNGKFYGMRNELNFKVMHTFKTLSEALNMEARLKLRYRLPQTEYEGASKGGITSANQVRTCPKCGKTIKGPVYFYHEKKCNTNGDQETIA